MIKEQVSYGVSAPSIGHSYEVIAKVLNIHPRSVKLIEQQALYKLRILGGDILGDFLEEIGAKLLKKKEEVIKNDLHLIAHHIHSRLLYFRQICSNPEHRGFKKCGARGIKCSIVPLEFRQFVLNEMEKMEMNTQDYTEFARAFRCIKIERIDKNKNIVLDNLKITIKG